MPKAVFEFREFTIWQDKCAMKVGTDGVLLGAWCAPADGVSCRRILDIGTGTGLIALICAQRWRQAAVDAVEIDPEAASQAASNFRHSPWSDRLHVHAMSLARWHGETEPSLTYDLIVSNPPYYDATLLPVDAARAAARHTDALSWDELMATASRRLAPDGHLAIIFPTSEWDRVATAAIASGLSPVRITDLVTREGKVPKRSLAAFVLHADVPSRDTLVIHLRDGSLSSLYLGLVSPFYRD